MSYIAVPVNFDGTNDYLSRGGGLTDAADTPNFTISLWFRVTSFGATHRFVQGDAGRISCYLSSVDQPSLRMLTSAATTLFSMTFPCSPTATGTT